MLPPQWGSFRDVQMKSPSQSTESLNTEPSDTESLDDETLDLIKQRLPKEALGRLVVSPRVESCEGGVLLSAADKDRLISKINTDRLVALYSGRPVWFDTLCCGARGCPLDIYTLLEKDREDVEELLGLGAVQFFFPNEEPSQQDPRSPVLSRAQAETAFSIETSTGQRSCHFFIRTWQRYLLDPMGITVMGGSDESCIPSYTLVPSNKPEWPKGLSDYSPLVTRALKCAELIPAFDFGGVHRGFIECVWKGLKELSMLEGKNVPIGLIGILPQHYLG